MVKKKLLAGTLATALVVTSVPSMMLSVDTVKAADTTEPIEITITKTKVSNPIGGYDADGNLLYGGDPAVLVDGDTVYLYTGHDTAQTEAYEILEWMCYSTKDLQNWNYEGVVMKADKESITWANTGKDAWAGQVEKYNGKYYLYYCTWDATSEGKQSIGVAVSNSATGPFEDIGEPLVKGTLTEPESSGWNDIDPTIYIEEDQDGIEHRYLAWGNGKYYICELNEDMISIKDLNGDGEITCGTSAENADIIEQTPVLASNGIYTEAPWLYRRKDADGNPTGCYYLFYALNWREEMAYSMTDDLMSGEWTYGGQLMPPVATSNTNHMAVFDFGGKTYFIYHNGSLPGGSGFRRNACIAELHFKEDGSIDAIPETAIGITGDIPYTLYTNAGAVISHESFINSSGDGDYPYTKVGVGTYYQPKEEDGNWAIVAGKADPEKDSYVSIQSENKPGLYLTVNDDNTVTLAQDAKYSVVSNKIMADADTAKAQTFRTVKGLTDSENAISFESVAKPGYYLCIDGGNLVVKALEDCDANANIYLNESPKTDIINPGTENDLKSLKVNDQELTREENTYSYTVPYTSDTVILEVDSEDETGFITFNDKVLGNSGKATIYLDGMNTEASICVYSGDQKLQATYTLIIKRDFTNFEPTSTPVKTFKFNNENDGAIAVTKAAIPTAVEKEYNYTEGAVNRAIVLDGTYGLKLCDAADLDLGESYTISFWMKPNTINSGVDPTLTAGVFAPEHWLNLTFDAKVWSKANDAYISTSAANAYKAGVWQNVILTVDGSTAGNAENTVEAKLYLDGSLISSGDIASGIMTNPGAVIYFGLNAWDAYFAGALDDVRIYNTVLKNDEIIAIANHYDEEEELETPQEDYIDSLTVNNVELTRKEDSYHYTVPYTSDTVDVKVTTRDNKGYITLNGEKLDSTGMATVSLEGLDTDISVHVYSEDELLKGTYILTIRKDYTDFESAFTPVKIFKFDDSEDGAIAVVKTEPTGGTPEKADKEYTYIEGAVDKAIVLDGTYGLKLCDAADLNLGESYTISFWMNPNTINSGVDPTLTAGTFSPEHWLNLTFDAKIWSNQTDKVPWIPTPAANAYTIDTWQNVILTVDGDTAGNAENTVAAKLYLNGKLISFGDIASNIMTNPDAAIYFGLNAWDAYFAGALDDVRIYNAVLEGDEIAAIASVYSDKEDTIKPPENEDDVTPTTPGGITGDNNSSTTPGNGGTISGGVSNITSTPSTSNNTTDSNVTENTTENPSNTDNDELPTTTRPDGTVVETKKETTEDGTIRETIKETAIDGSIKETVTETNADNSIVKEMIIETAANGATTIATTVNDQKNATILNTTVEKNASGNVTGTNAVISAGPAETTVNGKTASVTVNVSNTIMNAVSENEDINSVVIEITKSVLSSAYENKNVTNGVTVNVNIDSVNTVEVSKISLTSESVSEAKTAGQKLAINITAKNTNVTDYKVVFPVNQLKKISDVTKPIDITVKTVAANKLTEVFSNSPISADVTQVLSDSSGNQNKIYVVSIPENTDLTAGMKITTNVSANTTISANQTVYVYRYNEKTGKFVEVANSKRTVAADSTIVIDAKSGINYVVSKKKLTGSKVKTIKSQVTAKAAKTSVKAGKNVKMSVSLPATLKQVDSFTSSSAFGKEQAVVTYKSSNKKVATITAAGTIKTKKAGKVTITVTVQMASGQTKNIKKNITIK